ncbi:hypothetical protein GCM10029976_028390 [Kribbella albertanoniae]|uniref:Uncharacterized protein n=1 Tax=Kribbella albertanoniae TaxID=1266829 RepID=A0A4R4NZC8_9ACTN|nr:hypothetical protein [Kribbella albertanoniae]TDC15288.1 hypothetical protein E1261_40670 [Kribbella albertanoniae]
MDQPSIELAMPAELAEFLVENDLAEVISGRRNVNWELLAGFATGAATTVSLLQTPKTLAELAQMCRVLFGRRKTDRRSKKEIVYLEASGPGGQVRIPITAETSTEEIERLLRRTVFTRLRDK